MQVGRHTYGSEHITELFGGNGAELIIGKYCSIAEDITAMLSGNHRVDWISTFPFHIITWVDLKPPSGESNVTKGNIVIGNDVWLGREVMLMSGVTIADGAVIGARSVVTHDIGPYEIWAGNPARCKRARFTRQTIEYLCRVKWWDWPDEHVHRAAPILMSGDIAALKTFVSVMNLAVPGL